MKKFFLFVIVLQTALHINAQKPASATFVPTKPLFPRFVKNPNTQKWAVIVRWGYSPMTYFWFGKGDYQFVAEGELYSDSMCADLGHELQFDSKAEAMDRWYEFYNRKKYEAFVRDSLWRRDQFVRDSAFYHNHTYQESDR